MHPDIAEILLDEETIQAKVKELAARIDRDYAGKEPVLVCILKGAVLFAADLLRGVSLRAQIDFMAISSYGQGTESSGVVRILKDLDESIEGRDVLIVEDIMDSGLTLEYLLDNLRSRQPAGVKTVVFLDKPARHALDIQPDYLGFHIPDRFVVGYGLDYAERYRNLPYIGVLKPEIYREGF